LVASRGIRPAAQRAHRDKFCGQSETFDPLPNHPLPVKNRAFLSHQK
jgi:hypothetical protein